MLPRAPQDVSHVTPFNYAPVEVGEPAVWNLTILEDLG
jgi:hypothetical protein